MSGISAEREVPYMIKQRMEFLVRGMSRSEDATHSTCCLFHHCLFNTLEGFLIKNLLCGHIAEKYFRALGNCFVSICFAVPETIAS